MTQLALLAVHAHPDDESMSTGGTLARYSRDADVRTVVVTCTDGAVGLMLDPDRDPADAIPRLAELRRDELACAVKVLGIDEAVSLGYRDSGMAGTPENEDPRCFHQADLVEATRRLVEIVRRNKPQVIVSYNENGGYGHPDHINAHKIAAAAFDLAGDAKQFREAGDPWQPQKLYYTAWPRTRMIRIGQLHEEAGRPNPFADRDPDSMGTPDELVTTSIDIGDCLEVKRAAWRCHRTQITEDFLLLHLDDETARRELGREFFVRARSLIDAPTPEDDLFAGLRP